MTRPAASPPVSRRHWLRTVGAAAALPFGGVRAQPVRALNWSVWDTNSNPACFADFSRSTGLPLQRSLLSSSTDAQFDALRAGGGREWDVINPTIDTVGRYIDAGLLKKLDLSKIPAVAEMYPTFRDSKLIRDGNDVYALPYLWGLDPLVYRRDRIKGLVDYDKLFDPAYKGRIAIWDFALTGIGVAAMHMGIPADKAFELGTRELAEVRKVLLAQKPLVRAYWKTVDEITQLFASGEVSIAFSWRNPYDQLKATLPMALGTPAQGAIGWCDCFALPAGLPADRVDKAYQLANHLLGKAYAQCIGNVGPYATTNASARSLFSAAQQKLIFIDQPRAIPNFLWPKAPPNYADWQKLWTEVTRG